MALDQKKLRAFQALKKKKALREAKLRIALLCFYYPVYSLQDAIEMDSGDADLLINVARREQLARDLSLLNAVAAATNQKSYKDLSSKIKKEIDNLEASL